MKKIRSILLVIFVGIFLVSLMGCGKKDGIVGSWKYESGDYTYVFKEDGTGYYEALGNKLEYTYTTTDNKLSITYTGNTVPFETEFSIDGDVLNIKDSFGNDTFYNRQK